MALLIPGLLWGGDLLASAQSSTSGADLAQQYLAALGPAGTAISTAEAKLKALPITASVAQVQAAVAPLPKALGPLEALIKSSGPSPTGTSLQSLGSPTMRSCNQVTAGAVRYSIGPVAFNGKIYQNVLGFAAGSGCYGTSSVAWTWKLPSNSKSLTATVAINPIASHPETLWFNGSTGRIPFTVNGTVVNSVNIHSTSFASISISLVGQKLLTVQLSATGFGMGTVDFITNRLVE
jgi:hypothetical protein